MAKIFISYRQKDSRGDSRNLYNRLAQAFGHENVFFEISKIELGVSMSRVIPRTFPL